MNRTGIPEDLHQRVRLLQTIWFALLTGLMAALVAFWVVQGQNAALADHVGDGHHDAHAAPEFPMALLLAGVGGVLFVLAFILPEQAASQLPGTFATYQVTRIIQGALLEGAGMMQGVAYLLEGHWWSLGLGGAFVVAMLALLPTRDAATRWLQHRTMR